MHTDPQPKASEGGEGKWGRIWKCAALVFLSFYGAHLLWFGLFAFGSLVRGPGEYLGVAIPNLPFVMGGHLFLRVCGDPIPLAFVVALTGALVLEFSHSRVRTGWLLMFGVATYAAFNAYLLIQAPGALVSFPILRKIPFLYALAFLALLPSAALALLFAAIGRFRVGLVWIAAVVLVINLPHDTIREIESWGRHRLPADRPRLLVTVIDAARYDDMMAALPKNLREQTALGISHFGSTRKQWRLLLTGDLAKTERSFLLPTREELRTTDQATLIPVEAGRAGLRTAFLIDDPRTVNRSSLGIDFDEYGAPSLGMLDGILPELTLFPINSWLWNIYGSVEGANPWSRSDVFFRDMQRALRTNDIVFAHTIVLQTGVATYEDLNSLFGSTWLKVPPTAFHFVTQAQTTDEGVDALELYRLRIRQVVAMYQSWSREVMDHYQVSGLMTSDHGQEFSEIKRQGKHYSGLHGWDLSPDVVWTPLLPFGHTTISGPPAGHISWLGIREGIEKWIKHPGKFDLPRVMGPDRFRTHYIVKTQLTTANGSRKQLAPDLLTVRRILGSIQLDWNDGVFLSPEFAATPFRFSTGEATGHRLSLTNPAPDGTVERSEWNLYERLEPTR